MRTTKRKTGHRSRDTRPSVYHIIYYETQKNKQMKLYHYSQCCVCKGTNLIQYTY